MLLIVMHNFAWPDFSIRGTTFTIASSPPMDMASVEIISSIFSSTSSYTNNSNDTFSIALFGGLLGIIAAIAAIMYQLLYRARLERQTQLLKTQVVSLQKEKELVEQSTKELLEQSQRESILAQHYRQALRHDPTMVYLPLQYQDQPVELLNMYVKAQVQRRTQSAYLDHNTFKRATLYEPYGLRQASHAWRDHHTTLLISPEQAIRLHKHCLFIGEVGSGKTTLLKYLALKASKRQLNSLSDLPIYLELGAFAHSGESQLLTFAAKRWQEDYGLPENDARKYIEKNMQSGSILLLLDGFDETYVGHTRAEAEATHQRVYEAIRQLVHDYSQIFLVVTAHSAFYQHLIPLVGFTELEIVHFREQQIEQFLENSAICFHNAAHQESTKELGELLKQNRQLYAFASNPLLLSLLFLVYRKGQPLPDTEAGLYHTYITSLLSERGARHRDDHLSNLMYSKKANLLARLAWYIHTRRHYFFQRKELDSVLDSFLLEENLPNEQHENLVRLFLEEGWLKRQGHGWYSFTHLTFQAYFAASYLASMTQDRQISFIRSIVKDFWWGEVILFYPGSLRETEDIVLMLLEEDNKERDKGQFASHESLLLAGRCWTAHTSSEIEMDMAEEKLVPSLFQLLTDTHIAQVRDQAAEILVKADRDHINNHIINIISDAQASVERQTSIVQAMSTGGNTLLLSRSFMLLHNERIHHKVRVCIAQALGISGVHTLTQEMLSLLVQQPLHGEVRTSIALALGQSGDTSITTRLLSHLSNTELDLSIRISIIEALGSLGERSIIFGLQQLYTNSETEFALRWRIAIAMIRSGNFSVVSSLLTLFTNSEYPLHTLIEIACTMSTLGMRSLAFDLLPLLANEAIKWEVRASIAYAIEGLGERALVPQLLELLLAKRKLHPYVHISICNVVATLGKRSVLTTLNQLPINQESDPYVYRNMQIVLGKLGERTAARQLLPWLRDEQISITERHYMLDALSMLREDFIVPELLSMLSIAPIQPQVRYKIVAVLTLLAQDTATKKRIAPEIGRSLALKSNIQDDFYRAWWSLEHRFIEITGLQ